MSEKIEPKTETTAAEQAMTGAMIEFNTDHFKQLPFGRCPRGPEITKQIITYWENYKHLRADFDKNRGIIQPIRAIVREVNCWHVNHKNTINQIIQDAIQIQQLFGRTDIDRDLIRAFRHNTTTVGYLIAEPAPWGNHLIIGWSFCRPQDYPKFMKWYGLLRAFKNRKFDTAEDITSSYTDELVTHLFDEVPYLQNLITQEFTLDDTDDHEGAIVYYLPFTLYEQISYFINRCVRYFKLDTKGK